MGNKNELNKQDWKRIVENLITFIAPVAVIYLVAIVGLITAANGALKIEYLIPNSFTMGAIVLYIANSLIDIFRKFRSGK